MQRIHHRWAGLRTVAAHRSPVVSYDTQAEGLFWLAGQGGYGIQMAAALLLQNPLPAAQPARLRRQRMACGEDAAGAAEQVCVQVHRVLWRLTASSSHPVDQGNRKVNDQF